MKIKIHANDNYNMKKKLIKAIISDSYNDFLNESIEFKAYYLINNMLMLQNKEKDFTEEQISDLINIALVLYYNINESFILLENIIDVMLINYKETTLYVNNKMISDDYIEILEDYLNNKYYE